MIEGLVPGTTNSFYANHVGLMERVVVREFPLTPATEWRRGAWEQLCAVSDTRIVRCIEAREESGWRYEVSAVPPSMTVREWMACHRPSFADIEALMKQMVAALGALHAQGVVHLNIRPETLHIDESKGDPVYLLGGLDEATLYTQPEIAPSEIDPFYAPPEAVSATNHPTGTRLCAWDWWSVGRVVQEFLLGQHVFSLVFDCAVAPMTAELRARAELLQLEQAPAGVRAGAMDFTIVDPGCMPLLRGLLTSAHEARWGLDAVQRWLKREPVRDHYDLPRDARMWNWKGRIFTVAEAAEFFTRAENWDAGEDMLFDAEQADTLAHFLREAPAYRADWDRLQAVCDLAESAEWGQLPVAVRRTVTAAAAWLALSAGAGSRGTLRVRGQTIDLPGLGELLRLSGNETGVALLLSLLSPPLTAFVEPLDATAARVLKSLAPKGGAAVMRALERGWVDPNDAAAQARLLELSLQSGAVLRERADLLRAGYATNVDAQLAAMLANKSPEPWELVVLAFTGEAPERHGYITHEDWRRQRTAALKAEGERIAAALWWLRLRQLFATGRLWGAPSLVFAAVTLALTAVAGWWTRDWAATTLLAAALLLSRVWLWWRLRGIVRRYHPAVAPWKWGDGAHRAAEEATRMVAGLGERGADLTGQLRKVRLGMAEIASKDAPAPDIAEPQWWDLRLALVLASAVCVGVAVRPLVLPRDSAVKTRNVASHPPAIKTKAEPAQPTNVPAVARAPKPNDPAVLLASGKYEVVDDGFGRRLRGPLKKWDFFAPPRPAALEIEAQAPASPEQRAFALVSGTLLLQPYARKSVSAILAVRVPTTRGFGVMLFNARDRQLLDHDVFLVRAPLAERTWYRVRQRRVFFLGSPLPLDAEISLAQP